MIEFWIFKAILQHSTWRNNDACGICLAWKPSYPELIPIKKSLKSEYESWNLLHKLCWYLKQIRRLKVISLNCTSIKCREVQCIKTWGIWAHCSESWIVKFAASSGGWALNSASLNQTSFGNEGHMSVVCCSPNEGKIWIWSQISTRWKRSNHISEAHEVNGLHIQCASQTVKIVKHILCSKPWIIYGPVRYCPKESWSSETWHMEDMSPLEHLNLPLGPETPDNVLLPQRMPTTMTDMLRKWWYVM